MTDSTETTEQNATDANVGQQRVVRRPKPTGGKNYGSIGHLPNSRLGPADHKITDGQAKICCEKKRDKHDRIIIQEKLDGSNVGVARVDGKLYPIARAGYEATTSPFEQHHKFHEWAMQNSVRFLQLLEEGERAVGEWMYQAHGTRYDLPHEPFVMFDIMTGKKRITHERLTTRNRTLEVPFVVPATVQNEGEPMTVEAALAELGLYGRHGAIDPIEGVMYRVERNSLIDKRKGGERVWEVDYLAKFVQQDKQDGCFLESVTGNAPILNSFIV